MSSSDDQAAVAEQAGWLGVFLGFGIGWFLFVVVGIFSDERSLKSTVSSLESKVRSLESEKSDLERKVRSLDSDKSDLERKLRWDCK